MKQKKNVLQQNKMSIYKELDGEVFVVDNLSDLSEGSKLTKTVYNIFVVCNHGKIQVELNGSSIMFSEGQLCVVPSGKMVKGVMVSPDVNVSVLCVSDKVLKSVMGHQIAIWNKAMYLQKIHVTDAAWCVGMKYYIFSIFKGKRSSLFKEIALSFLRTFMLMLCEQFNLSESAPQKETVPNKRSARDEVVFNQFLDMLAKEPAKRQPVTYYASALCITPKYLASICTRVSGKSPMKWIMEYTMEDIYSLLRLTDKSLKEIAMQTGFPNTSFFGKYFRAQSGMTPRMYRNHEQRTSKGQAQ